MLENAKFNSQSKRLEFNGVYHFDCKSLRIFITLFITYNIYLFTLLTICVRKV